MPEPFVELERVTVVRGGRTVLDAVDLEIRAGEQVVLLGPNGCGKSTLLKTMTCELYPLARPETRVRLFGRERWDLTELKKRLGVVQNDIPGKPMLKITGREAILTGFFSSSMLWPNLEISTEMQDRGEAVLRMIGGEALAEKLFGEMSAGQQRRILIGRALVASSGCLLLDEPSNALDLYAQRTLRELMMQLAEAGTTMLLITHQVADIIPAMGRTLLMRQGRMVADGSTRELLTAETLSALFETPVHLEQWGDTYHAR